MVAPKDSKTYEHSAHGCGKVISTFTFTHVYNQLVSQKVLFEESMLGTCKDFLDGQNCLVFAYGVTNSGKTYTMQGELSEKQQLHFVRKNSGCNQWGGHQPFH